MNSMEPDSSKHSKRRRIALALFSFVSRSLQQVSTFVITLLAARFLAPAEYGVYSLGVVFITLIQTLTYTGFYHFIVTSKLDNRIVLGTSFWMLTGLATIAAATLASAAYPIAWIYDNRELGPVLIFLAAIQPVAGINAWYSATLLRRQAMNLHFIIMFAQNAIALVGGVVMLWLWQSLYALVAFRYLRVLSGLFLYVLFGRDRPSLAFDRAVAVKATGFSGGLYGARLMTFLSRYSGDLLLGYFYTTAEAGLYRFGTRVASGGIDIVAQPMQSFALTQLGSAARQNLTLEDPLKRFVGSITVLTGLVASVLIVFAPGVVSNFFDPAYMAALVVTYAMAIRSVTMVGTTILEPVMAACDQTSIVMLFNGAWTGITAATVFLVAPFGLEPLAWSQAGVATLASLSALLIIQRKGKVPIGKALQGLLLALGLVLSYGLSLYFGWAYLSGAFFTGVNSVTTLICGLTFASVLMICALFIAVRARVFTLGVFSG